MVMRKFTQAQLRAIRYYVMQMDSIIDDLSDATDKCWSSYKINAELDHLKGLISDFKLAIISDEEINELFE